jgi:GWxTD domain-containing protein
MHISVVDLNDRVVKEFAPRTHIRRGNSVVETGKVDVAGLISGTYNLLIKVTDDGTEEESETVKSFFLYQPSDYAGTEDKEINPYANWQTAILVKSEEELDREFLYCRYIANKEEKDMYGKLDLPGKRDFLTAFWKKRDQDPSTDENEYRSDYLNRIFYSNRQFSHGPKEGWRTDQGRVFMVYGKPDQVDTFPSTLQAKGYEIWYYDHARGQVMFVFIDLTKTGELRLVHSTALQELQNYEWNRQLY